MTFTAPLGLLALAALPAILALHLFRQRRKRRRVAGLFLFLDEARILAPGRKPLPLEASASLILELLAALALALALGGLALEGREPVHLVLVLDDTASMGAVTGGRSARERASALAAALAGERRGTVVTVITTGDPPALALGPRAPAALLDGALASWRPERPHADPGAALALARELRGPASRIVLLTDRPPPAPLEEVEVRALGEAATNRAIVAAFRVRGAGASGDGDGSGGDGGGRRRAGASAPGAGERLVLDLASYGGDSPARLRVRAADGDERVVAEERVMLRQDRPLHLEVALAPALAETPLRVDLDGDALALDDAALLLPAPIRRVRVRVDLEEGARRALRLDRALAATGLVDAAREGGAADLVIRAAPPPHGDAAHPAAAGRAIPAAAPTELWVHLAAAPRAPAGGAGAGSPVPSPTSTAPLAPRDVPPPALPAGGPSGAVTAADPIRYEGPFLVDRAHPLALGLGLDGVAWSAPAPPEGGPAPALPGRPVIEAGGRALLAVDEVEDAAGRAAVRVHLAAQPAPTAREGRGGADNDLVATDAWPVLVLNLVEVALDRLPGARRTSLAVGEAIVYRPRAVEAGPFALVEPGAGPPRAESWQGGALRWLAATPGVYRVTGSGGATLARYAVSFADPRESDLAGARTATVAPAAGGSGDAASLAATGVFPLAPLLALAALAALVADWRVLARAARAARAPAAAPEAPASPGGGAR